MGYKKSETSCKQIIRSAVRVVARQGYAGTSLLDIAQEAGMSKGAVHYHFPTKEALIERVLEVACETVVQRSVETWQQQGSSAHVDSKQIIRQAMEQLWLTRLGRDEDTMVIADLWAQSQHQPSLQPKLTTYYRQAVSKLLDHLAEAAPAMGLRPKMRLEVITRTILGLLDGMMMQALVDEHAISTPDAINALQEVVVSMFEQIEDSPSHIASSDFPPHPLDVEPTPHHVEVGGN